MEQTFLSKAGLKVAMVAPKRCRLVVNLIRGQKLEDASRLLLLEKVKGAKVVLKVLRSAVANAQQKGPVNMDRLVVSKAYVDEGPRIKRWMPRSRGSADPRWTRTSHIWIELSEAKRTKKAARPEGVSTDVAAPKASKPAKAKSKSKTSKKKTGEK